MKTCFFAYVKIKTQIRSAPLFSLHRYSTIPFLSKSKYNKVIVIQSFVFIQFGSSILFFFLLDQSNLHRTKQVIYMYYQLT